jgi:hypothetical protein
MNVQVKTTGACGEVVEIELAQSCSTPCISELTYDEIVRAHLQRRYRVRFLSDWRTCDDEAWYSADELRFL